MTNSVSRHGVGCRRLRVVGALARVHNPEHDGSVAKLKGLDSVHIPPVCSKMSVIVSAVGHIQELGRMEYYHAHLCNVETT